MQLLQKILNTLLIHVQSPLHGLKHQ